MSSVVSLPRISKQRCSSSLPAFLGSSRSKRLAELSPGKRGSAGITLHYLTPVRLFRHTPLMSFTSLKPRLAPIDFLCCHWFRQNSPYLPPGLWGIETNSCCQCQSQRRSTSELRETRFGGCAPHTCWWEHSTKCIPVSSSGTQLLLESETSVGHLLSTFQHLKPMKIGGTVTPVAVTTVIPLWNNVFSKVQQNVPNIKRNLLSAMKSVYSTF